MAVAWETDQSAQMLSIRLVVQVSTRLYDPITRIVGTKPAANHNPVKRNGPLLIWLQSSRAGVPFKFRSYILNPVVERL